MDAAPCAAFPFLGDGPQSAIFCRETMRKQQEIG